MTWLRMCLLLALSARACTVEVAAAPTRAATTVFSAGEGGFPCVRVPSLLQVSTALACISCRQCSTHWPDFISMVWCVLCAVCCAVLWCGVVWCAVCCVLCGVCLCVCVCG